MCPYAPRPRHPRTPHRPAFLSDAAPRSGHVGAPRGSRRCRGTRGGPAEIRLEAVSRRLPMRRHMSLQTPYSLAPSRHYSSDHSGRSKALREHDESQHEHLHTRSSPLRETRGVFLYAAGPHIHSLQARMEKLALIRSFGAFKGTARARHVTTRTPPHSFVAAERDAWCIPLRSVTSHAFCASPNGKARTH